MTITELSIKRPTLVVVVFSVLAVLGLFGFSQLNYELLPKISAPVVTINTVYPGASPYEVETNVTKPIEDAVSGVDRIDAIRATSFEGVSFVIVEFKQNANIDIALQDVSRKVGQMVSLLPDGAEQPTISKIALDEIPVLRVGVTSSMDARSFYQFLKDRVQPRIAKIYGVAQVVLSGGEEREIKVNLDPDKLRGYGLSILQVAQVIKAANLDFPTGRIKDVDGQFIVRVAGKFHSIDDLRQLVVGRSRQGGDIHLDDVAEVQDGSKEVTQLSRVNGISSVGLQVVKQSDANAVNMSRAVRAELVNIQQEARANGVVFDIAQDGSLFTVDAANAVKFDLGLAVVMVALVMLLFLHSLRNSLIVMVAIPTSLVTTFIFMYALGFTLNLMTLLGLSLVIGILVDDSIVVLENIYHHLEKGEERRAAALRGRNEIGFAALSITLVDVVVFLPLSIVGGLVGNILREFALVVVASTLTSLFVSFTVTPMLASRFSTVERLTERSLLGRFALGFERLYLAFAEHYQVLLRWALAHKRWVGVLTVAMFIGAMSLPALGLVGNEFFSQTDRGEFTVTVELPPGSPVEETNRTSLDVERVLAQIPEVRKVFTNVGVSADGLIGFTTPNVAQLSVALVPKNERSRTTDDIVREIKDKVRAMPGTKVYAAPIGIFGTADQAPIQIVVNGTDMDSVLVTADRLKDLLASIQGTADVRLSAEQGNPEMQVDVDRAKLAQFGLSIADVGSALRIALTGDNTSRYRDGNNEYDIRIQLDEYSRSRTADLGSLSFVNARGQQIQLQQFATIYQSSGPTKLQRQDRIGAIYLTSQIMGRPSGTLIQEFKQKVSALTLPPGISLTYLGQEKNRQEGFGSLGLAMLAGILFVYLIMVALYDSYIYPFVVLFSIPVAMVGAMVALAITGKALSIFSILGIIMLTGLVAKNAILLVDRANQTRLEQNLSVYEALLEAGRSRLRPILMTTLTMVFGMMPIALSRSAGAEWKTGLAWALIGGLTSSMFLTLLLVPVVYMKVDEWRTKIPALFAKPFASWRRRRSAKAAGRPQDLVPSNGNGTEVLVK